MYKNIVGKREDYEIIGTATNEKEEEELIYTIKPDVVITDNQMPIQNGIDVRRDRGIWIKSSIKRNI